MFHWVVTPGREQTSQNLGLFAPEDLSNVGQFSERDLVPDARYVVKYYTNGCVIYPYISHLCHVDDQNLPDIAMQKYVQGAKEGLSQRPTLASPQQEVAGDCSKNHVLRVHVDVRITLKLPEGSHCGVGCCYLLRDVIVITKELR